MILGLSTSTFTLLHVLISLVGLFTGFVTIGAMLFGKWLRGWNALFLVSTIATSVTGFFFHSASFGPPHVIGIISLALLAVALLALYPAHLAGRWRWIYVSSAIFALYLNSFVAVVQAFQKYRFWRYRRPPSPSRRSWLRKWSCWRCSSCLVSSASNAFIRPRPPKISKQRSS